MLPLDQIPPGTVREMFNELLLSLHSFFSRDTLLDSTKPARAEVVTALWAAV